MAMNDLLCTSVGYRLLESWRPWPQESMDQEIKNPVTDAAWLEKCFVLSDL